MKTNIPHIGNQDNHSYQNQYVILTFDQWPLKLIKFGEYHYQGGFQMPYSSSAFVDIRQKCIKFGQKFQISAKI